MKENNSRDVIYTPLFNSEYNTSCSIQPRTKDATYIPAKKKKKRPYWDFNTSIFKDWKRDTEVIFFLSYIFH